MKFRLFTQLASVILGTSLIGIASSHAATFDDGNDRRFVNELRATAQALLSREEKAILAAANKVGAIGLCNGKNTGNAFLILYRGRPAVVTSAHFVTDPNNGRLLCSSEDEVIRSIAYAPNSNFYDPSKPKHNRDFIFRKVELEFPPANWARVQGRPFPPEEDFLVFYLKEDITRDQMPDGSKRGYLHFSKQPPARGNLYMIGFTGDMGGGMAMVYQSRCDGFLQGRRFYHGCDSRNGSSASLIGTLEDGEIAFSAAHNAGDEIYDLPSDAKMDPMKANIATSSGTVVCLMRREGTRPDFIASELQAGVKVPRLEPDIQIREALEEAASEGMVCD
ncbi:MAG: hypothetical protein WBA44_10410 [Mesorhizobium sp.]